LGLKDSPFDKSNLHGLPVKWLETAYRAILERRNIIPTPKEESQPIQKRKPRRKSKRQTRNMKKKQKGHVETEDESVPSTPPVISVQLMSSKNETPTAENDWGWWVDSSQILWYIFDNLEELEKEESNTKLNSSKERHTSFPHSLLPQRLTSSFASINFPRSRSTTTAPSFPYGEKAQIRTIAVDMYKTSRIEGVQRVVWRFFRSLCGDMCRFYSQSFLSILLKSPQSNIFTLFSDQILNNTRLTSPNIIPLHTLSQPTRPLTSLQPTLPSFTSNQPVSPSNIDPFLSLFHFLKITTSPTRTESGANPFQEIVCTLLHSNRIYGRLFFQIALSELNRLRRPIYRQHLKEVLSGRMDSSQTEAARLFFPSLEICACLLSCVMEEGYANIVEELVEIKEFWEFSTSFAVVRLSSFKVFLIFFNFSFLFFYFINFCFF
jgi:hypothetical protein